MNNFDMVDDQAHYAQTHCKRFAACMSDACSSGRKECPTPDACELPEPDRMTQQERIALVLIYVTSAVLVVSGLWHLFSVFKAALP